MNKIVSGWLILNDGDNKGKVALQRRSVKNKHFPFLCQATWSGKVEDNEDVKIALQRECMEELGKRFNRNFNLSDMEFFHKDSFVFNGEEWEAYNYFGEMNQAQSKSVELHDEAFPELIFIGKKDEISPISSGKDFKNNVVLFDDQYKVLKKFLNGN